MRIWLWIVAWGVLGTITASSGSVHAQSDDARARTHFEAGRSYYDQARYAEAVREFQASYDLSPHPELLLNISQAQERALNYDAAIAAAQLYLTADPKAQDRKTVEDRIANLQELKQRYEQGGPEPLPPPGSEATAAAGIATQAPPASTPGAAQPTPPPAAASLGATAAATAPPAEAPPPESGNQLTLPAIILMGTG
ncbi:MAG TPA: hypothetical protein VJV78_46675, partial [Polyangiales bacterium]|nr:hypothetical protein [Polyangiales bacterium]